MSMSSCSYFAEIRFSLSAPSLFSSSLVSGSKMVAIQFSAIRNMEDLAKHLGTSVDDIRRFIETADQGELYERKMIPKKGRKRRGQFRTVYKAWQDLGVIQKNISTAITTQVTFPEYVQGFVHKRSIVTNARIHLSQKLLLHADIKDFFESIKTPQIVGSFESLGCRKEIASVFSKLCTLNGFLPQGSSASPALANLVCKHLDIDLKTLADTHKCKFSRYGDDITFSGDSLPPTDRVEALLNKHGYELRDGKCRIQRRGRSQYVTGLTTFDDEMPRISRRIKKRLRLELYYAERFGLTEHLERADWHKSEYAKVKQMNGWISFLYSVEPNKAAAFDRQWRSILSKE